MSKKNNILFILEGEKAEKNIADNLLTYFINEKTEVTVIQAYYGTVIYSLYKKIKKDEDLDTFSLLKEMEKNKTILAQYQSKDFAEIYLFFDYDGHTSNASDEKLEKMLDIFSEETEKGKLYISYPMVEALKHYSQNIDFKNLKVKAKENTAYKKTVNRECSPKLVNFCNYTPNIWANLIELHLKKMNFIVSNNYTFPQKQSTPLNIFLEQKEKYIDTEKKVAVLSSFPLFLLDYYGNDYISNFIAQNLFPKFNSTK